MTPLSSSHLLLQRNRQALFIRTYLCILCHNYIRAFNNVSFRTSIGRNLISSSVASMQRKKFPNSEKDKDKKDDDGKVASIVSRLSLDNYFGMWRLIQKLLAGGGGIRLMLTRLFINPR